jgi:predicted nucleic acid-binding protein
MKLVVTDASVWVSRLVPEDSFHERIKAWMTAQRSDPHERTEFLAPSLLLAEIGGAISRRTAQPALGLRAVEQVKVIPGLRLVEMDRALVEIAANLAVELGLRGADSFYVAVAARLDLPLATLDVDQKVRAATRIGITEFR